MTIETADLFNYAPETPFDVVGASRLLHGFRPERQRELAARFYAWLRPGGVCVIETLNSYNEQELAELERRVLSAGFFERGAASSAKEHAYLRPIGWKNDKRFYADLAEYRAAEWQEECRRLDAGEKMVIFWHSSG